MIPHDSLRREICMATGSAGRIGGLHRRGNAGFGAEAFAEILLQIQPCLGTAIQSLQNRIKLGRDLASLVLAVLPSGPACNFRS